MTTPDTPAPQPNQHIYAKSQILLHAEKIWCDADEALRNLEVIVTTSGISSTASSLREEPHTFGEPRAELMSWLRRVLTAKERTEAVENIITLLPTAFPQAPAR